jgi:hypothetical protein
MTLDDLLRGSKDEIESWLSERGLVHECDCGYTVYDPDAVNEAVQAAWGDERCNDIFDWACNLSNEFGWLFLESSIPDYDIYRCQHCAGSEWSLFLDMQRTADKAEKKGRATGDAGDAGDSTKKEPQEHLLVYVDESYENEFPRKPGGCYAYAAVVIPESAAASLGDKLRTILTDCYRGRLPKELKHKKIAASARLLECVGPKVVALLSGIPGSTLLGLFMPRDGYFGEKTRGIRAAAYYEGKQPEPDELAQVMSNSAVEEAVGEAASELASTLAACIACYVAGRGCSATVILDPIAATVDQPLLDALRDFLPRIPHEMPHIRHNDTVLTLPPSHNTERLGANVKFEVGPASEECPGLQLADFFAGDIRTFFTETPEVLIDGISKEPLVNKHVIFPQLYHVSRIASEIMAKVQNRMGTSFLPLCRRIFARGVVSCCTMNGQLRHINLVTGELFDLID